MTWVRTSRSWSRSSSTAAIIGPSPRRKLTGHHQTPQFYWQVSRIAVAEAWAAVITRVGRIRKSSGIQMTSRQAQWIPSKGSHHRRKDHCSNSSQTSGKTTGVSCSSSFLKTNLALSTRLFSHRATTPIKRGRSIRWTRRGRRAPSPPPPSVSSKWPTIWVWSAIRRLFQWGELKRSIRATKCSRIDRLCLAYLSRRSRIIWSAMIWQSLRPAIIWLRPVAMRS